MKMEIISDTVHKAVIANEPTGIAKALSSGKKRTQNGEMLFCVRSFVHSTSLQLVDIMGSPKDKGVEYDEINV